MAASSFVFGISRECVKMLYITISTFLHSIAVDLPTSYSDRYLILNISFPVNFRLAPAVTHPTPVKPEKEQNVARKG